MCINANASISTFIFSIISCFILIYFGLTDLGTNKVSLSIYNTMGAIILKENVFLFNDPSIDLTNEVLDLFNEKTKSMSITITLNDKPF